MTKKKATYSPADSPEFGKLSPECHENVEHLKSYKRVDGMSSISCFLMALVLLLIVFVLWIPISIGRNGMPGKLARVAEHDACSMQSECNIQLVESIPEGLNFSEGFPQFLSTYQAWQTLFDLANKSLNIGALYWTLRGSDVGMNHSTAVQGEAIFNRILANAVDHKLNIKIAQSMPTANQPSLDTAVFAAKGAASVRSVDFPRLIGNGVLHTKVWIADNEHFYLGSANMDWRSLTQIKEVGVLAQNCPCLAQDVMKIFNAYWYLGQNSSTIPEKWPAEFATEYNLNNPMIVKFNNSFSMSTIFSSSPPPLVASGRTGDLEAILNIISTARSFINIAVMDFMPLMLYTKKLRYWPYIDDALRTAAIERKVSVKLLISWWEHSREAEDNFLESLEALSDAFDGVNIEVRRFIVPSNDDQSEIPFARVNHNKYMVTDNVAYIGTSNWSGDYFTNTAGIGLIFRDIEGTEQTSTIRTDLVNIFRRDWNSPYAVALRQKKCL